MRTLALLLLATLTLFPGTRASAQNEAEELRERVVNSVGGMDALHQLKDVEYTYTSKRGTSTERYIFDGEISYGMSTTKEGKRRRQYFDGENVRVWIDDVETTDENELKSALFTRKTNYYWLAMMQKMSDPGLQFAYAGTREFEGIDYDLLDVTFNDNVGVAKDRYLLYVNPHTGLVDQFLFTVMAYERATPIMMKYTYDTFANGVKLPVVSQSHGALNWEGDLDPKAKWGARWRTNFSFNNGFEKNTIYLPRIK
ncbi:DUF6503 family protein [Lewinella sp. 4G2]|uniref:DUF6503 family protein n=1 Tax=Lewinella sp. 4G2 TaxID=1803372 RepID=UPI0012F8866D|nr:DUF6503 family protein [Lewinella sp. 4G2]